MYQVSVKQFNGPLDLLLQLVEKRSLEITQLSLAEVTQDYLNSINSRAALAEDLADFLVIASTLLLIKSKSILPALDIKDEEKEEILDLEERLRLYKRYKDKAKELKELFLKKKYLFGRQIFEKTEIKFLPPPNFSIVNLPEAYKRILALPEEKVFLKEEKIKKIATLKERIQELIKKLTKGNLYCLADLVSQKTRKAELIITFLAILHLSKEKLVAIKQEENFGDIWISSK